MAIIANPVFFMEDDYRFFFGMFRAWRGFEPFAATRSLELLDLASKDLLTNVYGPQNIYGDIPGRLGSAIGLYNDSGTIGSAANMMQITTETLNIQWYGPQMINEGLFRASFGSGYNQSLNALIK